MRGKQIIFTADLPQDITPAKMLGLWQWMKDNLGITSRTDTPSVVNTGDGKTCTLTFDEGEIVVRKRGSRVVVNATFYREQDITALKTQLISLGLTGVMHTIENEVEF